MLILFCVIATLLLLYLLIGFLYARVILRSHPTIQPQQAREQPSEFVSYMLFCWPSYYMMIRRLERADRQQRPSRVMHVTHRNVIRFLNQHPTHTLNREELDVCRRSLTERLLRIPSDPRPRALALMQGDKNGTWRLRNDILDLLHDVDSAAKKKIVAEKMPGAKVMETSCNIPLPPPSHEDLVQYIFHNYKALFTEDEHKALHTIVEDRPCGGEKLLLDGELAFYDNVTERIVTEHSQDIILNCCPRCGSLCRTPTACLCPNPECNHTWFEKRKNTEPSPAPYGSPAAGSPSGEA